MNSTATIATGRGFARIIGAIFCVLIAATGSAGASRVALAEARLAEGGAVQIVERRAIDRLLAEQRLSLAGLAQGDRAVGAGKVLSAELLAVLEAEGPAEAPEAKAGGDGPTMPRRGPVPGGARAQSARDGSTSAGLIVFDTTTGVRLWDAAVDLGDAAAASERVAEAVTAAEQKRGGGADLRPVCVLAVRNADLPHGMDGLCDAVGRLLERELLASPGLALLERSRLDQVNREAALAGAGTGNAFLASVVVVELEVGRAAGGSPVGSPAGSGDGGGAGGLRATAVLSDVNGKGLGKAEFSVPGPDPAGLTDGLAGALARQLKAADEKAPAGADRGVGPVRLNLRDRAVEAARFCREATVLASHHDFIRALPAAEAAVALAPDDRVYQAMLALSLIDHGDALYRAAWMGPDGRRGSARALVPQSDVPPPTLVRGAEMLGDVALRAAHDAPPVRDAVAPHFSRAVEDLISYLTTASPRQARGNGPMPPTPAGLVLVKAALRRYLLDIENAQALAGVHDGRSFAAYSARLPQLLADAEWCYSRDSAEWTSDVCNLVNAWLDLLPQYEDERALPSSALSVLQAAATWLTENHRGLGFYNSLDATRMARWDLTAADRDRFAALAARLSAHPDPNARLFGKLCQVALDVEADKASPPAMRGHVEAFIADMKHRFAELPAGPNPRDPRPLYYELMIDADQFLDKTPFNGDGSIEVMDFMLSRKEVHYGVLWRGYNGGLFRKADDAERSRRAEAAARIVAVLDDPACQMLQGVKSGLRESYGNLLARSRQPTGPLTRAAPVTPWTEIRKLVDVFESEQGMQWVTFPILEAGEAAPRKTAGAPVATGGAGTVLALGISSNRPNVVHRAELLRFPLDGGPPQAVATATVSSRFDKHPINWRSGSGIPLATAACLHDGWYVAGTWDNGLLLFPTGGDGAGQGGQVGQARQLDDHNGLPTRHVTAVAGLGGKIYAGLGLEGRDGYLVSYDPGTGQFETLASSLRKDKHSPFDDGTPFLIKHLAADAPRDRLIVAVQRQEAEQQVNGLWEYKPDSADPPADPPADVPAAANAAGAAAATRAGASHDAGGGRWRQLLPIRLVRPATDHWRTGKFTEITWGSLPQPIGGRPAWLWYAVSKDLFLLDLETDKAEVLFRERERGFEPRLPEATPWHRPDTAAARSADQQSKLPSRGYAVIGDWLWAGAGPQPWGRLSLADGRREDFPMPREQGNSFQPVYLQPLAAGPRDGGNAPTESRILVGDGYGLWVVTVPPAK